MTDDPWNDPLVRLPDLIPIGVGEPTFSQNGTRIVFETLRAFLERQLPPAESLCGVPRNGTNLIPRYGWVMPWGREASGKTSVLVDLLFHAAAGHDWLIYPIGRPLRIVVIVNEGIPGGFQDKLAQKIETWPGDTNPIVDNLAVYASPWGEFSFRHQAMAEHARNYALDFQADYVALDPLHTLGTTGAGKPEETEAFKHTLRQFGLWQDLGVITAHHSNKNGMISGDWARHPDTVIHLEKDGKNPATKLTLEKARPADPNELGVPVLLEWVTETLGYTRRELDTASRASDQELLAKVLAALDQAPAGLGMEALREAVGSDANRVRSVVLAELEKGENGQIRNASPRKRYYELHRFDPNDANEPIGSIGSTENQAQTRMDTSIGTDGDTAIGSTDSPAHPSRSDRTDEPMGDYVVVPIGDSSVQSNGDDQKTDDDDELF